MRLFLAALSSVVRRPARSRILAISSSTSFIVAAASALRVNVDASNGPASRPASKLERTP